jgi:hypothetical protein
VVMEDAKRESDRVLKVERGFEWSRLEGEVMALVYERVLPVVRAISAGSPAEPRKPGCDDQSKPTGQEWRYATGA